ncbi:MAG: hypothetical protein DMG65_23180 [Candidatus Angelobacter sp. Gp1-AA117]|nr:MAG: hypothetical protein DMG65_23180 [Candidatus Angelobacter sp. Gp1-AA117]
MSASIPGPGPASLPPAPVSEVFSQESANVWTLIATGDSRKAVDIAKRVHERCKNAASENLLIDAYVARISALFDRSLHVEAKSLMELVRRRYPVSRERLRQLAALLVAGKGDLDALLQPLNDPSLPSEKQAAIYRSIRIHVGDLGALAGCGALPAEHPLRAAASVLARSFEDVTSRPVEDSALAFPEISRQNPLASWKMLLRSIAAFYRRDDELCRKCLAAIEPDSAVARLAHALRALMGEKIELSPAALALVTQVGKNSDALRSMLQKLEQHLHRGNLGPILKAIRETVAECMQSSPDLLERLRQHICVRALVDRLDQRRVHSAMGGPPLVNAYFWRLMARAIERQPQSIFFACGLWEEFRRHALHENWFPGQGPELAALYLHMASLLNRLPHDKLPSLRREYTAGFPGLAEFYSGQPPEIQALKMATGKDFYYLDPSALLERACETDPCAENFSQWFNQIRSEPVAWRWRIAFPKDVQPLLHLMEFAEKRGALQKSFKFMKQAEELDGLSPVVRKARLRLLMSIAIDHLRRNKVRKVELDLAEIEALPQVQQGDRLAFVAALRWVSCVKWGSEAEALRARDNVVRLLNSAVAAEILLSSVAGICKLAHPVQTPASPSAGEPLVPAVSRACLLLEDMGFGVEIPPQISTLLIQELAADTAIPETHGLAAVGEVAWRMNDLALAYTVSTAGLAGNPASQAQFLFLRARILLSRDANRHDACLSAASELARRNREQDLLDRIGKWREQLEIDWLDPMVNLGSALSTEEVNRILDREKKQHLFPVKMKAAKMRKRRKCDCPACRLERGEMPRALEEMADKYGPDIVAQALEEILGRGGTRERGKRRGGPEREFNDFDIFRERL